MDHKEIQGYREQQFKLIPKVPGVYGLADWFQSTLYVGRSDDGLRARTQRHVTSGRSDLISNQKLSAEEIAFIWFYEEPDRDRRKAIEDMLIYQHHQHRLLMNSKIPAAPPPTIDLPSREIIQIIPDVELAIRRKPINAYKYNLKMQQRLLDYIEQTKDNRETRNALQARVNLTNYHRELFERECES